VKIINPGRDAFGCRTGSAPPSSRSGGRKTGRVGATSGAEISTSVADTIQHRLTGRGHHLAIELNGRLAAHLAHRYPAVDVVTGPAATLPPAFGYSARRPRVHAVTVAEMAA